MDVIAPAQAPDRERWLTSGQVARIFKVSPPTVRSWDTKFSEVERTMGGHRRYRASEVLALHAALQGPRLAVAS